jgi:MoxR-like ATPase
VTERIEGVREQPKENTMTDNKLPNEIAFDPGTAAAMTNIAAVRKSLEARFFEREAVIRGLLVSVIAGEHPLLLGPPGTAKSALINALAEAMGNSTFSLLLTKYTTPEEVFGPVDIQSMKQGSYKRQIKGRAWDSQVVFLDEIFKASSSILNSLLTLMQERVADNDGRVVTPLEILVGASNEYPADESLNALFDRFSAKYWVEYIGQGGNMRQLFLAQGTTATSASLQFGDLHLLRKARNEVPFGPTEADLLLTVKDSVEDAGFVPSDRTWVKCITLLRASAVLDGRQKIAPSDFRFLADVLWKKHDDRPKLLEVIGNAADPYGARSEAILDGINLALRSMPEWSTVESGQVTKAKAQAVLVEVNKQLMAEINKLTKLKAEAGDHADVIALEKKAKAAMDQFDKFSDKVLWMQ